MNWTDYHMGFAEHAALKSKDKNKVGAVAIGKDKQIVETGYNGPPRGVRDLPERQERPAKYLFTAHAEANLVATAARERLLGTTVYVTHFCCSGCAKSLIQAGVAKIVFGDGTTSMPAEEFEAAKVMFNEAGVKLEAYKPEPVPVPEPPTVLPHQRAEDTLLKFLGLDILLVASGLYAKTIRLLVQAGGPPSLEVEVYSDEPFGASKILTVNLTTTNNGTYTAKFKGENK